jgi:hypothetical protein
MVQVFLSNHLLRHSLIDLLQIVINDNEHVGEFFIAVKYLLITDIQKPELVEEKILGDIMWVPSFVSSERLLLRGLSFLLRGVLLLHQDSVLHKCGLVIRLQFLDSLVFHSESKVYHGPVYGAGAHTRELSVEGYRNKDRLSH